MRVITVASTAHSKRIRTPIGFYVIHQLSPDFFHGCDWNAGKEYLIATPEKALVDCLYLASRKGRQYAHFPELDLDRISKEKTMAWTAKIRDARIRQAVSAMARGIFQKQRGRRAAGR
jgi:hypothetical protein